MEIPKVPAYLRTSVPALPYLYYRQGDAVDLLVDV